MGSTNWLALASVVAAIAAFLIAAYQANLLRKSIQLTAILELDKEWNGIEMSDSRRSFWTDEGRPGPKDPESVLEFLEKVSSLEESRIIDEKLIWDTFGWYVMRYWHYSKSLVEDDLRIRWTHRADATLYQDLEKLAKKLIEREAKQRKLNEEEITKELDDNDLRRKFAEAERDIPVDAGPKSDS